MSVYRPKDKAGNDRTPYYHFDFTVTVHGERRRVHGSTGETSRRAAEVYEKKERDRIIREGPNDGLTLVLAVERYAEEVLTDKSSGADTMIGLTHCVRLIGADKRVRTIVADDIANAVRRRSAEFVGKKPKDGVPDHRKLVSPATVNRNVIETMRALLNRAANVWGVTCEPHKIEWKKLARKEPKARDRELSSEEAAAFWMALRSDYHPFTRFQFGRGLRLAAALALRKKDVDLENHRIRVWLKKKGFTWVRISRADAELLREEMAKAPLPNVWTYDVQRGAEKGMRRPLTVSGYRRSFETALRRAKIEDFRRHDMRHDFGTKLLRATRNLALVKEALAHSDISSTIRYAHVLEEDVFEGLNALADGAPRNSTEAAPAPRLKPDVNG